MDNPSCGRTLELNESIQFEQFCADCYDLFKEDVVKLRNNFKMDNEDFIFRCMKDVGITAMKTTSSSLVLTQP